MATWYVSSTQWTAVAVWQPSHSYSVGDICRQTAGIGTLPRGNERVFRCTVAGTSGGVGYEPTWVLTAGATTSDNTVTWTEITGQSTYGWFAPHASLWQAIQSGWASGDSTIYVGHDHDYSWAVTKTYAWPGTASAPTKVLCVNTSTGALATTAVEDLTGGGTVSLCTANQTDGQDAHVYQYGITWETGSSGSIYLSAYREQSYTVYESCTVMPKGAAYPIYVNESYGAEGQHCELRNCTLTASSQNYLFRVLGGTFRMIGGSIAGTAPTSMISHYGGYRSDSRFKGVDLSLITSSQYLVVGTNNVSAYALFENCKFGSGFDPANDAVNGAIPAPGCLVVELINCDSGDTNYRYFRQSYEGIIQHEATIVRTGGATDGTTTIARKMVSAANVKWFMPLELHELVVWNETVGSAVTVTVHCVTDGVTLTDTEAWIEVEYLGTSGSTKSTIDVSDRAADILATPADQATSTETWTTTGLSSPVYQKFSASVTPQEKGPIRVRVCLAKASTTVYVCPKVEVS